MNPWLLVWEMADLRIEELRAEAKQVHGPLGTGTGARAGAGAGAAWASTTEGARGRREWLCPKHPRTQDRPALWARASAWAGNRMIVLGCRLERPALVAMARSKI